MIHAYDFYPSHIAKVIAFEVGLLSDMQTIYMVPKRVQDEVNKLIEFQQMSLVASFEDCLVIYYGIDLTKEQTQALKLIYEITPKLLQGSRLSLALGKVESERKSIDPDMRVIISALHTAVDCLKNTRRKSA